MPLPLALMALVAGAGAYSEPYPEPVVYGEPPRRSSRRSTGPTPAVVSARRAAVNDAVNQLVGLDPMPAPVLSCRPWTRAKQLQHGIGTRKADLPAKATQPRHIRRQAQKAARRERFAAAGGAF